jgi:hypothetical protein
MKLEDRIERSIAELKDNDEYGWASVIETLEECKDVARQLRQLQERFCR